MPSAVHLIIYALAFARLTILITLDKVTEGPRDRALTYLARNGHPLLAYFTSCPWCVSIWLGIPAAPLIYYFGETPWLLLPATWLALSMAAGIGAQAKG